MTKEKIDSLIERAGKQAGFKCPECDGEGEIHTSTIKNLGLDDNGFLKSKTCHTCKSTGKDPNINTSELLMNIVCELSDAVRAWDKVADLATYESDIYGKKALYFDYIKGTREHLLAGAFIRLLEYCAYKEIPLGIIMVNEMKNYILGDIYKDIGDLVIGFLQDMGHVIYFNLLRQFCNHHNIDIEKHIDARLSWECAE